MRTRGKLAFLCVLCVLCVLCGEILQYYFGGSGSILSRMRTVSRTTLPTISRLLGLSLSIVSCGV